MIRPARLASAVVARKKSMAEPVILPVVRMLPIPAHTPITMEQNTSGRDHKVQCVHVDTTKKAGNSQNRGKTSCKEQTGTDTENEPC